MPELSYRKVNQSPNLGLSETEIRNYSFLNVIRYLLNPSDPSARKAAGFEIEASDAFRERASKMPKGLFVPTDILQRDYMGRGMATYNGASGGYLVETGRQGQSFIECLENAMVLKQAGAVVLRDLVGDLAIPKQTGGATAYWIGEGEDLSGSAPQIGQVALRPKTIGSFTDLTRKFILQSSIDAEMFVRTDLATRLALAIDLAGISGTGASNQPLGVLNTSGIGSVTWNAQNTPDWGDVCDLESALSTDNALSGALAYIVTPTIFGKMKQTEKVSNTAKFICDDGHTVNGYPCFPTNQMTALYGMFGNWADMVIGEWSGVDVNVDTATLSKSGGVRVCVYQDVDVAVRHAESFALGYHE